MLIDPLPVEAAKLCVIVVIAGPETVIFTIATPAGIVLVTLARLLASVLALFHANFAAMAPTPFGEVDVLLVPHPDRINIITESKMTEKQLSNLVNMEFPPFYQ